MRPPFRLVKQDQFASSLMEDFFLLLDISLLCRCICIYDFNTISFEKIRINDYFPGHDNDCFSPNPVRVESHCL